MFDKSLLPPAQLELVVISDTHYMLDPGDRPVEFESRRKQTARAEVALKLAVALKADEILHLGDIAQEYPETERFQQALSQARSQMNRCGFQAHFVPGNQDVGDKPDASMPTRPVTPESLAAYHATVGPSCYSFERAGCHIVALNTQLLNANLPDAESQRRWLEDDLAAHAGQRTFLFLHLPPYLWDQDEPGLGHYDNIQQPARAWLLDLVRRYRVEFLAAGHVHFAFFDRLGRTRFHTVPSPAFTRPGFSHLFTGPPPPEQGRDDVDKLGFYLLRVLPDRTDIHFIRTAGAVTLPQDAPDAPKRLVTRTSAGLPASPVGLTLRHPLAPATEIPLAWPSSIRQRVRNDYPLLAALELGATAVRVPCADLADPLQSRRLSYLRDGGVKITATVLRPISPDLPDLINAHHNQADRWELQIAGRPLPSADELRVLNACRSLAPLALSPVLPGERRPGVQIPRTRIGYHPAELEELNRRLADADLKIDRVLCRINTGADPWQIAQDIQDLPPLTHIDGCDLAVELLGQDDLQNAVRTVSAGFAAARLPGSYVYFEPLVDLDRTMDVNHGLLDTLCNPRPAFHALRSLNTVLYSRPQPGLQPSQTDAGPLQIRTLTGPNAAFCLVLPESPDAPLPSDLPLLPNLPDNAPVRLYRLCEATVQTLPLARARQTATASTTSTPLLIATA